MTNKFIFILPLMLSAALNAQTLDYSLPVQEESELNLDMKKITSDNDCVYMPTVRKSSRLDWMTNNVIGLTPDGKIISWISVRNNSSNIFVRALNGGAALQRTNRRRVLDFNYSPDGSKLCFSESDGRTNRIFTTNADKGYVCKQITYNEWDYSPIYSADLKHIYFTREEKGNAFGIWRYDLTESSLSYITNGINPYPIKGSTEILCVRASNNGNNEIWKINYETGEEVCIVSDAKRSFSSPTLSPDGKWILMVGNSEYQFNGKSYPNTDIFVCSVDGTNLTQLTYHPANDLSPQWSNDGQYIYFVSQRGNTTKTPNIWRLTFNINQ